MLMVSRHISIPDEEVDITAVRARGAGGQNVNKVATAVHLRFDIGASSLPEDAKARILDLRDRRVSADGVVVIKAQRFRSQDKNRQDAMERLAELIRRALVRPRKRVATKPTRAAKTRRLDGKVRRGRVKDLRRRVVAD